MAWWSRRRSEEPGNDGNDSGWEHPAYPMSIEVFEDWLARLEPATEAFIEFGLPEQHTAERFTRDSLEQLGPFILWLWPDVDAVFADQRPGLDGMVRYVGETFRRRLGGTWAYSTHQKAEVRGRPYLELGRGQGVFDPFATILGTVDSRKDDYPMFIYDLLTEDAPEAAPPPTEDTVERDAVASFVAALDQHIADWAAGVAAPAEQWDHSLESLSSLGELLTTWELPTGDLMDDPATGGACRYLGETLRRLYGGDWDLMPGDKKDPDVDGVQYMYSGRFHVRRQDPDRDHVYSEYPEYTVRYTIEDHDPSVLTDAVSDYAPR